jgi:hypothetical protein
MSLVVPRARASEFIATLKSRERRAEQQVDERRSHVASVRVARRGQAADRPMDATGSKSTRVLRPCSARLVSCSGAQTPPRVRARSRAAAPHLPSTDDDGAPPYRFAFALRIRWMPRYGNLAMPGVGNKCVPGCPRCQVATLASPPYTIVSIRPPGACAAEGGCSCWC